MTKEELKEKLTSDPEARKKFIAATADYYKSVGLAADHKDLTELSDHLTDSAAKSNARRIFPIIIVIVLPGPLSSPAKKA
jgi:hypothetical protein